MSPGSCIDDARVVLDCRWLSIGGAGRATELLLRGLAEGPAPPRWVLWGPPLVRSMAWEGAELALTSGDPRALFGQRHLLRIPKGELIAFMHQQRPLRRVPCITVVHDTTPLRHGSAPLVRRAKARYLRRVAATSCRVVTASSYARRCIEGDLGVAADRISVVPWPCDEAFARRVAILRNDLPIADVALYVGNFLPHKNVPRLIEAFGATRFRRDGGRLLLVGGSVGDTQKLVARLDRAERSFVEVRPTCAQDELDRLFAGSRFLVQPSLEEGFGMPAWEALSCGLPVAASDGGSLPEVVGAHGERFEPTSVPDMAAALDRCADRARRLSRTEANEAGFQFRRRAPTISDLAASFRDIVAGCLGDDRPTGTS